ncbi:hypothetical protein [Sphingobium sp. CFD-2]|uniref:hypothetical protein n=1 Tax=Sphingobium sp. CFD-2 TaxID=2878542 RepID=UPI00214BE9CC|nr:hypothetical protein [Sphingobium sp. CFD-2]
MRAQLLERFPPTWPDVIADHVTLQAGASANEPLPAQEAAEIVGRVDDGEGLQALIVSIDGSTDRPDGSTYHITWSLDRSRGRKAVQSNDVIAERGWEPLPTPVPIHIQPARF